VFAEAAISDRLLTVRASARIARGDATDFAGAGYLSHGQANIQMCGLTGSIDSPVKSAVFEIGLAGTTSKSQSDGSLVTQAFGVARFNGVILNCAGDYLCPPVTVPWTTGGCYTLDLRADAAISNPAGASGWDAEASADFSDTMQLLAVHALDDNDQPIPDFEFSVTDANGTPVTIPNTVQTTTTSTTTVPGTGVTTTTIVSGGCVAAATYDSVRCRIDALLAAVGASDAGALAPKLTTKLTAARAAVDQAEQVLGQRHGKASKIALKKALKALKGYERTLASKKARRTIADATRAELGAPVAELQAHVQGLPTSPTV
jgi:hypothetical protein